MDLKSLLTGIVTASVGVVVVTAIAMPVVADAVIPEELEQAAAIKSMLGLVPLMLIIAIVMGVVAIAIGRSKS